MFIAELPGKFELIMGELYELLAVDIAFAPDIDMSSVEFWAAAGFFFFLLFILLYCRAQPAAQTS